MPFLEQMTTWKMVVGRIMFLKASEKKRLLQKMKVKMQTQMRAPL